MRLAIVSDELGRILGRIDSIKSSVNRSGRTFFWSIGLLFVNGQSFI